MRQILHAAPTARHGFKSSRSLSRQQTPFGNWTSCPAVLNHTANRQNLHFKPQNYSGVTQPSGVPVTYSGQALSSLFSLSGAPSGGVPCHQAHAAATPSLRHCIELFVQLYTVVQKLYIFTFVAAQRAEKILWCVCVCVFAPPRLHAAMLHQSRRRR